MSQRLFLPERFSAPELAPEAQAPRVPWSVFLRKFNWQPGEHVALVGSTGSGKSEMLKVLLGLRAYTVVFATKPRDDTMQDLIDNKGFKKYDKWKPESAEHNPRRVIWPDATEIDSAKTQAVVLAQAFAQIFREGYWTLALDESWFITNILGLDEQIKVFLLQARSLGISLIQATQRPVSIPVETWDQSTWLFIARENDFRNLERLGGTAWKDARAVRYLVANLEQYQFLVINTRTGLMLRTRIPTPRPVPTKKTWMEKNLHI